MSLIKLRHNLQQDVWLGVINSLNFRYILRKLSFVNEKWQTFSEPRIPLAMTTIRVNEYSANSEQWLCANDGKQNTIYAFASENESIWCESI